MAVTQTIEWTLEGAWISVLQDSNDLMSLLSTNDARVRREYDLTAGDQVPCVTVQCPGALPQQARMDGYYVAITEITAWTSMDDDQTGSTRANIAGAIRDVFEASGLAASLQTASSGSMLVFDGSVEMTEAPEIADMPYVHKRVFTYKVDSRVTMLPSIVSPEE